MQGGEERPRSDGERAARDLLDAPRDAEPVQLAQGECLEDEEVEGALEEIGLRLGQRVVSDVDRKGGGDLSNGDRRGQGVRHPVGPKRSLVAGR